MQPSVCKKCNRAVYLEHLDENGLCCFCAPKEEKPQKKAATKKKLSELFEGEKVH